jgi:tetratricopeptide (TPR) repeat protein
VRNRSGQWREVEQFSRHAIIIHDAQKCQAFLREKQTLSASRNRIQKSAMSRPRLIVLLLALTTIVVYLPVVHDDFVNFDDQVYVTENPHVQAGLTWDSIRWAFTSFHGSNWHPLTWLSHMADCELFGLNPGAHHFVNVLFHVANVILLFVLLLRLTGALWPCAFIAALFAWHPLHVESVAWISERKDVLSTFFALLSLLSYAKYVEKNCRRSFWFALVLFALGLMSKPMLVTLPFVMLLLDYWPLKRLRFSPTFKSRLLIVFEKIPFFLLAAISCVVTFLAQREEAVRTFKQVSLPLRFENAATATATYLSQIFWPSNLAVFYPMPEKIALLAIFISTTALVFISVLVWLARKQNPCLITGWLWFLGTLVPVIGLVKVGDAAHADRYTYFPAIGIFIAVVFGTWSLLKQSRGQKNFIAASLIALVVCVVLTEHQLQFWRDSEILFRHTIAVTQNNATAHLNLGSALQAEEKPGDALQEYHEALSLDPNQFEADSNIGKLLFAQGKFDDALPYCELAVRLKPDRATLRNNLGLTLAGLGRFDEALAQFAEAMRLDETYVIPRFQTGRTLLKIGRDAEAMPQLFAALQIEPDNLQFLIYTARVLASDENPQGRDGEKAFVLASHANQLTGSLQPVILDTLAMTLAELNHFEEAQKNQQQAIELVEKNNDREDLAVMQQRLKLYENQKPWRESFLATNAPVKN